MTSIVILGGLGEIPVVTRFDILEMCLSTLEVEPAPPSLGHLRRLVRAQLIRVPFENITKLHLKKTLGASY
jgi:arylamine N-acetyltransferase